LKATFDRFDGGLVLSRPSSVAPANSLGKLMNMDVQPGGWLRARPKWKVSPGGFTLDPQWKGLESNAGYLWTFGCWNVTTTGLVSAIVNNETGQRIVYAFRSTGTGGNFADATPSRLMGVTRWNNGFVAVLTPDNATYYPTIFSVNITTNVVTATAISDVNMPNSGLMVTATSRIFAVSDDGQLVRFSAIGNPADWTTAGSAGFLPVAQYFGSGQRIYGLGIYQGKLAVFADQSIQIWTIDPDPTAMALDRVIDGVGTRHHSSIVSLFGDLLFLSESGIRSLTTLANSLFPTDIDIGLPIRSITKSPAELTRITNGGIQPSVIAMAATPYAQYWIAAPNVWVEG
jgi:hypothetical protein